MARQPGRIVSILAPGVSILAAAIAAYLQLLDIQAGRPFSPFICSVVLALAVPAIVVLVHQVRLGDDSVPSPVTWIGVAGLLALFVGEPAAIALVLLRRSSEGQAQPQIAIWILVLGLALLLIYLLLAMASRLWYGKS